ncbi:unnamed protein product, partial [Rotaria sp. Silwood2]
KQILDETLNYTIINDFQVYDEYNNRSVSSEVQRHQIGIKFIVNFYDTNSDIVFYLKKIKYMKFSNRVCANIEGHEYHLRA